MHKFYTEYSLEYMTPYGLIHSFETFCSENSIERAYKDCYGENTKI